MSSACELSGARWARERTVMFAAIPASICERRVASARARQWDEGKGGLTQASAANATAARLFHWLMISNLTFFGCQRAIQRRKARRERLTATSRRRRW